MQHRIEYKPTKKGLILCAESGWIPRNVSTSIGGEKAKQVVHALFRDTERNPRYNYIWNMTGLEADDKMSVHKFAKSHPPKPTYDIIFNENCPFGRLREGDTEQTAWAKTLPMLLSKFLKSGGIYVSPYLTGVPASASDWQAWKMPMKNDATIYYIIQKPTAQVDSTGTKHVRGGKKRRRRRKRHQKSIRKRHGASKRSARKRHGTRKR